MPTWTEEYQRLTAEVGRVAAASGQSMHDVASSFQHINRATEGAQAAIQSAVYGFQQLTNAGIITPSQIVAQLERALEETGSMDTHSVHAEISTTDPTRINITVRAQPYGMVSFSADQVHAEARQQLIDEGIISEPAPPPSVWDHLMQEAS